MVLFFFGYSLKKEGFGWGNGFKVDCEVSYKYCEVVAFIGCLGCLLSVYLIRNICWLLCCFTCVGYINTIAILNVSGRGCGDE